MVERMTQNRASAGSSRQQAKAQARTTSASVGNTMGIRDFSPITATIAFMYMASRSSELANDRGM